MTETASDGSSIEDRVFETAKEVLARRADELSDAQTWVTGTEVASLTDIEKDEVLGALRSLGATGRLHVKTAAAEGEIEVLGVEHETGADSTVESPSEE